MSPALVLMVLLQATAPEAPVTPVPDVEVTGSRTVREGTVTLECIVQRDGRVTGCVILSEDPPGQGFGEAALRGGGRARLSPRDRAGVADHGKVRFTVRFQLQD